MRWRVIYQDKITIHAKEFSTKTACKEHGRILHRAGITDVTKIAKMIKGVWVHTTTHIWIR